MAPLFAFVVMASPEPLTSSMAREHYELVDALKNLEEPEFSNKVRGILAGIATRWLTRMNHAENDSENVSDKDAENPAETISS
jgi:hypothetical protein